MWNQNPIEVLKLSASIATPLAIAFIGLLINRSIQRQNAIAERQSSWLTKWADDFLKLASVFNDSATSFIMLFQSSDWKDQWKKTGALPEDAEEPKLFKLEAMRLVLALLRGRREMSMYTGFAPVGGKDLDEAAKELFEEANSWVSNKGGSIDLYLKKQVIFNFNARKVHAELLGLKDSKG